MPKRTIYVRDEDSALVAWARKHEPRPLGEILTDAIRRKKDASSMDGMLPDERIGVSLWDDAGEPTARRVFTGRWLVGDGKQGLRPSENVAQWDADSMWSVAQVRDGRLVVYSTHATGKFRPGFEVYSDFPEFEHDAKSAGHIPKNVVDETRKVLRVAHATELGPCETGPLVHQAPEARTIRETRRGVK
jgi:hypothetical protein